MADAKAQASAQGGEESNLGADVNQGPSENLRDVSMGIVIEGPTAPWTIGMCGHVTSRGMHSLCKPVFLLPGSL
jgi:hypothetical protein